MHVTTMAQSAQREETHRFYDARRGGCELAQGTGFIIASDNAMTSPHGQKIGRPVTAPGRVRRALGIYILGVGFLGAGFLDSPVFTGWPLASRA